MSDDKTKQRFMQLHDSPAVSDELLDAARELMRIQAVVGKRGSTYARLTA